jgi:hypothetical protein
MVLIELVWGGNRNGHAAHDRLACPLTPYLFSRLWRLQAPRSLVLRSEVSPLRRVAKGDDKLTSTGAASAAHLPAIPGHRLLFARVVERRDSGIIITVLVPLVASSLAAALATARFTAEAQRTRRVRGGGAVGRGATSWTWQRGMMAMG